MKGVGGILSCFFVVVILINFRLHISRNKNVTFIQLFLNLVKYFTLPIGQVTPKLYLPHLNSYLPRARGQCLKSELKLIFLTPMMFS